MSWQLQKSRCHSHGRSLSFSKVSSRLKLSFKASKNSFGLKLHTEGNASCTTAIEQIDSMWAYICARPAAQMTVMYLVQDLYKAWSLHKLSAGAQAFNPFPRYQGDISTSTYSKKAGASCRLREGWHRLTWLIFQLPGSWYIYICSIHLPVI